MLRAPRRPRNEPPPPSPRVPVPFSDEELAAYLSERLPVERSSEVEAALRGDEALRRRLAVVAAGGDGSRGVGSIWREARLSCPTRDELGSLLLGALDPDAERYALFHVREVGCRLCAANLADLEEAASRSPEVARRRRRVFQSSAGALRGDG